jgi:hypothetical protein
MSDDPVARRYGPIVVGLLVLSLLFWAEALYQLGN